MVKEARYRKVYKVRKSFPRLGQEKRPSFKEFKRFGYGMSTDEYNRILFKLVQWSQAEFPGEIAIEVKTRVASEIGINKFMNNQMVTVHLGEKPPEMTQAEFNKMIVEAQKNYLKKRDEYLKDVKRFIGNMFKDFITEDLSSVTQFCV